jgi:hypothetical protein
MPNGAEDASHRVDTLEGELRATGSDASPSISRRFWILKEGCFVAGVRFRDAPRFAAEPYRRTQTSFLAARRYARWLYWSRSPGRICIDTVAAASALSLRLMRKRTL